jgi:hypothetical protein
MVQQISDAAASLVSVFAGLGSAVRDIWVVPTMRRPRKYRPEAHYMRGPGPKWFAKNAQLSSRDLRWH